MREIYSCLKDRGDVGHFFTLSSDTGRLLTVVGRSATFLRIEGTNLRSFGDLCRL